MEISITLNIPDEYLQDLGELFDNAGMPEKGIRDAVDLFIYTRLKDVVLRSPTITALKAPYDQKVQEELAKINTKPKG